MGDFYVDSVEEARGGVEFGAKVQEVG